MISHRKYENRNRTADYKKLQKYQMVQVNIKPVFSYIASLILISFNPVVL